MVCHRFHSARQRYASWLLQIHDQANRDTFPMTQEIVAQSLGIRRATVSEIARDIQQTGAVQYRRGVITMSDRNSLLAQACECYATGQEEYKRLLDIPTPNAWSGFSILCAADPFQHHGPQPCRIRHPLLGIVEDEPGKLLAGNGIRARLAVGAVAGKLAINLVEHAFQRAQALRIECIPQVSHPTE